MTSVVVTLLSTFVYMFIGMAVVALYERRICLMSDRRAADGILVWPVLLYWVIRERKRNRSTEAP